MSKRGGYAVMLAALLTCATALPAAAQSREALEQSFHMEHSLLERESERYAVAREKDRQALERLVQLALEMDGALFDAGIQVSELRDLDGELNVARETAMERLRATAELRSNIFSNLDRLDHLGSEIELLEDRSLVRTSDLGGVWEIDASTAFDGAFGLMKLSMQGTQITGTYRMSTGRQGSLRGSLVGDKISLTRSDSELGDDLQIEGVLDGNSGEITGTWKSKFLGTGRPEFGDWSARKISPGEAREVAEDLGVQ